jgi:hypothetical protein
MAVYEVLPIAENFLLRRVHIRPIRLEIRVQAIQMYRNIDSWRQLEPRHFTYKHLARSNHAIPLRLIRPSPGSIYSARAAQSQEHTVISTLEPNAWRKRIP